MFCGIARDGDVVVVVVLVLLATSEREHERVHNFLALRRTSERAIATACRDVVVLERTQTTADKLRGG